MEDVKKDFWERAGDATAGMLSAEGAPPRPMAHTAGAEDKALWFITAEGTDIEQAAAAGKPGQFVLACAKARLYAVVTGEMRIETSREKLDEIWSPMAAAWFEDGREDDDVRLVRFTPRTGEVWTTDGAAKSLYEMAKANMTDEMPEIGAHAKVVF